jgi:homoserine O-acetyltransferase/O-succinyltransferase
MNQAAIQPLARSGFPPPVHPEAAVRLDDGQLDWWVADDLGHKHRVAIRFRLHGTPDAPLVVALGGISANRQVQCWWRDLYGSGAFFNPDQLQILSIDWLDHTSTATAGISTKAQADALARVLDHLALPVIDRLIGASYGAMVGLSFAERHPERLGHLIAISGADRSRPFNTALRHIQREILRLGVDTGQQSRAVALARALALTTYRPPNLFDQRFRAGSPVEVIDNLTNYLDHVGRSFSDNFDAGRYERLSRSLDEHHVDPHQVRCPVDLVAVDSDQLVTTEQLQNLAAAISGPCRLHTIESVYGHDAFLKEPGIFNPLLTRLIQQQVQA